MCDLCDVCMIIYDVSNTASFGLRFSSLLAELLEMTCRLSCVTLT